MPPVITDALTQQWLQPDWQLPAVKAWCSTRAGDFSQPPYDGFNTANHVDDDPASVVACRRALAEYFHWQSEPQWLKQVHGIAVVDARADGLERTGDAVYTCQPGQVCTLHTADCLPVFFAAEDGSEVALAHAGWRGLAAGILESTLERFSSSPHTIKVWLGPAIGQSAFEVGADVREAFLSQAADQDACFQINDRGRWQCDLYELARKRLASAGIVHISGGEYCTFSDRRFFSFRRQPVTGRMLSMIWIDPAQ